METLKSYLNIIEPRLLNHISGKPKIFLLCYQAKNYISDNAFLQDVCKTEAEEEFFQNLKSRTLKILQALAFISEQRGANFLKKKFSSCQKKFLIGQKFIAEKDQDEGIRLIRQAYIIAKEYNFTYLACEMANILYKHHIYYKPNRKKANQYAEEMHKYMRDYMLDRQAEHYYLQYLMYKADKKDDALDEAIMQISSLDGSSLRYILYESILKVLKGFSTENYTGVQQTCKKALQFFADKKGVYGSHYQYFYSKIGIAQMATRQFDEADVSFTHAGQYAPKRSHNDYLLRLYKTINALHAGRYKVAYDLYQRNKRCKIDTIRQQFAIIEAYLCFLSHMGYLRLEKKFRLGKYLNENILSQSEKRGNNISILIAELLIYLARDRGKFIDRIEAINSYSYRHLRDQTTQRAKSFIKILCTLPAANFSYASLERRTQKHIDYLQATQIHIGQNVTIIELVPFTTLFDMITRKLKRKTA